METTDCTDKRRKTQSLTGQSLLELAVFGSIMIMLLGVLINYGLRYNYQQQVAQQTYRKALKGAADSPKDGKPMSVMYVLTRDKHIPDPSQLFGLGSIMPISASASVIRNHHMQEAPDTKDELPQITVDMNGQISAYKTAGFRYESNVSEDLEDKYAEIYGSYNVCWEKDCGASEGECLEPTVDEGCTTQAMNIKILDSAAGEVVDYATAYRQCRMIVDTGFCAKECERGKWPGSETKCNTICSKEMNPPNQSDNQYDSSRGGAWYCAGYDKDATGKYVFPQLLNLFDFAIAKNKPKVMGPAQDYTQETKIYEATTLKKEETASGIQTTDKVTYKDTMQRDIVYNDVLDANGVSAAAVNITTQTIVNTTKITTCDQNSTDCPYGYKFTTCSGDDCSQAPAAGGKTWQTNW